MSSLIWQCIFRSSFIFINKTIQIITIGSFAGRRDGSWTILGDCDGYFRYATLLLNTRNSNKLDTFLKHPLPQVTEVPLSGGYDPMAWGHRIVHTQIQFPSRLQSPRHEWIKPTQKPRLFHNLTPSSARCPRYNTATSTLNPPYRTAMTPSGCEGLTRRLYGIILMYL